jgi:uncharacterized membrane protein
MEHRVTTAVDAPADKVWQLFIDIERWPEVTRSIREVRRTDSGPLRIGSEVIVRQPRLPQARWRVTALEPGRSFTWEATVAGVTAVGGHVVEADGQRAVITLTLSQHGPLVWLTDALMGSLARKYLSMEMEGFRRTAESAPVDARPPGGLNGELGSE